MTFGPPTWPSLEMRRFHEDLSNLGKSWDVPVQEYGRFNQHLALLEDRVRVSRFLEAIAFASPGQIVVDVGAGTGVWALAALKRGFEHAFLVEPSLKMCRYAAHLAELNGLSDRVTILPKALEDIGAGDLPENIDLLVSETLSSVIFGFGSWDVLPNLAARVAGTGQIVPLRGRLFAALVTRDVSQRGPSTGGLKLLEDMHLDLDLFDVTFRSGGNVWDKLGLLWDQHRGLLLEGEIASFDFRREPMVCLDGSDLVAPRDDIFVGVVMYWTVDMIEGRGNSLTSIDPNLTSWSPLFVRFRAPVRLLRGETLQCAIAFEAVDHPYKYALCIVGDSIQLSERLYW